MLLHKCLPETARFGGLPGDNLSGGRAAAKSKLEGNRGGAMANREPCTNFFRRRERDVRAITSRAAERRPPGPVGKTVSRGR
jgi:hypothetical protein